jgi:hypothetical protein
MFNQKLDASIAFIGSVGVPNNYGGFEMFLESCSPFFVNFFDKVFITCDSNRYEDQTPLWVGVHRLFIPIRANGFMSILHDFFAFIAVVWRVKIIVVLGVSAGLFFPFFKLICNITGKKIIVNIDGVESRRAKFSPLKRLFLYWSDKSAQFFSHCVVIDNEALRKYLDPLVQPTAVMIAYPGDHVVRINRERTSNSISSSNYLTICRIEPENQCHILLEAFTNTRHGRYTFIGNWDASEYGRNLRQKYRFVAGLQMLDPIYDKLLLADFRENCSCYLHGHSVGGTNPSLVEMLFYDCRIIAFDCEFNRYTAGDSIQYFDSILSLCMILKDKCNNFNRDRSDLRNKYTRESICSEYNNLFYKLFNLN